METVLHETIYHGSLVVTLSEYPCFFISIVQFLSKHPADDHTCFALYHVLQIFDLL